jgi:hypothetical protein
MRKEQEKHLRNTNNTNARLTPEKRNKTMTKVPNNGFVPMKSKTREMRQEIYERIDELFADILSSETKDGLESFLKFSRRMPKHAPFNNALVFAQNPTCTYYATKSQWEKINRTIERNSHPMVILHPFAPVRFVYDITDTDGPELPESKFLSWWEEDRYVLDESVIGKTIRSCEKMEISVDCKTDEAYLHGVDFHTMGYAARDRDSQKTIALHPKYAVTPGTLEMYGVLCHEIAHHLLGHLGGHKIMVGAGNNGFREKVIARDRSQIAKQLKELEAELVAWLVFDMHGIEKRSAAYMAGYCMGVEDRENISMSEVLKVAKQVRDMGH